jgi:glycosyltransferase involved in cell wall biosynthesis
LKTGSLKVLSIWHGAVRHLNRERYDALAETEGLDLTLLAPRRWAAGLPSEMEFEWGRRGKPLNYTILTAPAWFRSHAVKHVYPSLFSILSNQRADLIDVYEEPYSLIAWLVAWWRNQFAPGTRFVFTACQNIQKRYPPPFRWMERYVLRSADAAMALDESAREVFRAKGYGGPFEVVPTGVDAERLRRVDARELKYQLRLTRPVVGYMGRLVEEKGVATLLEAAAGSHAFQLLIVGDGPEREKLQSHAAGLGVFDRIAWVRAVPSHEVPECLSAMDALVLPSRTRPHWKEQLGRVLIEAMACETPVIGSSSGAIPNVIGDAGLIFAEGNAAQLRERILRVLRYEALRRELAAAGRRRAETVFAWPHIARRTRALWQAALDREPLEHRQRH